MQKYLFGIILLLCLALPAAGQEVEELTDRLVGLSATQIEVAGKMAEATARSEAVPGAFNGVIVRGVSSDEAVAGWIRFEEGSAWGEWLPLYIVPSYTTDVFVAAYRGEAIRQRQRFEVRFTAQADATVRLLEAGVFDNRQDEDRASFDAAKTPAPAAGKTRGHVVPPTLITRSEWGAVPFIGDPIPLARPEYFYMTFHHAAGYSAATKEEGKVQVKRIQDLHQNGRGWSDIGYQLLLDRAGNVYQGRPFMDDSDGLDDVPVFAMGAHVGGANTGNIGVCLLGCYHPPEGSFCEQIITPAALDTIVTTFAFLSERYGVGTASLRGHRDFSSTACPGDNNYVLLPEIRGAVEAMLLAGNEPLGAVSLQAHTDADGVIHLSWDFIVNNDIFAYRVERIVGEDTTVVFESAAVQPEDFVDVGLAATGPVNYRLVARNNAGREQVLATLEVVVEGLAAFALASSYPNPFSDRTTIRYFLEGDGVVRLAVYDAVGREVATLVDGFQDGGQWYAQPLAASSLASGTYFYRLTVEGFSGTVFDETKSLVLVR